MKVNKVINTALVGFGYWGPNYARILSSSKRAELKWIVDLDRKLLKRAKNKYPGSRVSTNYKEVLEDPSVDALIIATPTVTHYQIVKDALLAHKNVMVEKPLANSYKDAQKLTKLAGSSKKVLLVGHTYLFHPAIASLKKEIKKGVLGNILFLVAQRTNLGPIRSDVNAMWDLAPHDISNILYLSDSIPQYVSATGSGYLNSKLEDVVNLTIKFKNQIFCSILVSWLAPVKTRTLTIVGDKKMAVFDEASADGKVKIIDRKVTQLSKGQSIPFSQFKKLALHHGETSIYPVADAEPLLEEVLNFFDTISKIAKPKVNPQHALEVVKVLEAASKSIQENRVVKL